MSEKKHKIAKMMEGYGQAQSQMMQFYPTFREFQRLAANVSLARTNPNNPFPYGEGTAASLIIKTPQRVLKKMPVGKLRNISNEFMSHVVEFLVQDVFMRNWCRKVGAIQQLRLAIENGMTYGFCTVTPFFSMVNNAYTVDWKMHYWGDVFPEVGITNINTGNVYIRDWWSKADVKGLVKMAKDDNSLNADELKLLLEDGKQSRPSTEQSEQNIRAAVQNQGYEVIKYYCYHDGKYMLYVFRPDSEDFIQKKEIPGRGHVTFYWNHDNLTAYGRSVLSLIGGIQMDLDQAMQNKRKSRQIEIDPMLIIKGWSLNKVRVQPGTVINLPPNGSLEVFKMETPSLMRYNEDHGADQSLIYNLAGYPEANVSGDVSGSMAIGKTPTAIKNAQGNIANADNQVADNLKLFLEELIVESLKIYFNALPEQFMVELTEEYVAKVAPIAPERFVSENVVIVDSTELDMFDYEVNIESSSSDVNQVKLDSIMKTMGMLEQSPLLAERVATLGVADDLIKEIIFASGLNNDSIARKLSFLDNPNMTGQPGGDPTAGQPIPPEMAMQMVGAAPAQQQNPTVQTQLPNPVRQQGVI